MATHKVAIFFLVVRNGCKKAGNEKNERNGSGSDDRRKDVGNNWCNGRDVLLAEFF